MGLILPFCLKNLQSSMSNCKVLFSKGGCALKKQKNKHTIFLQADIWPTKTPSALTVDVMYSMPALLRSQSTRIICDWRGRCARKGRGEMDCEQKGEEEWPWIKPWCRDVAQWAAVTVSYKAYDRCFSWKCITAFGLRPSKFSWVLEGIPNKSSQSFHNCHLTSFPVACT